MIRFAERIIKTIQNHDKLLRPSSTFSQLMSDAIEGKIQTNNDLKRKRKEKYDGRSKRRQWEDRNEETESQRLALDPSERVKRKKSIILLGYSGADYYGMQRNPEVRTIEEDLLKAMLQQKWINEEAFKVPQAIQFQRAARTDKGVSASAQCVSLKLPETLDIDALNKDLPEQIRIFCVKRVTKGFNSKSNCDARTYSYTLPTIAFADHIDAANVSIDSYRMPQEKVDRVNEVLKMFEGTKNFHNFTCRKEFLDPSSKRFIMSFELAKPFLTKDTYEFAVIKIKGQSFMMHQIRKMIGLTLAVVRGLTSADTVTRALGQERLDIPMAPGLGLVLDKIHYDRYNQRYGEDGVHEDLSWIKEEDKIKEFTENVIIPVIVDTEINKSSMSTWLETLAFHSYDVRPEDKVDGEGKSNENDDDDE